MSARLQASEDDINRTLLLAETYRKTAHILAGSGPKPRPGSLPDMQLRQLATKIDQCRRKINRYEMATAAIRKIRELGDHVTHTRMLEETLVEESREQLPKLKGYRKKRSNVLNTLVNKYEDYNPLGVRDDIGLLLQDVLDPDSNDSFLGIGNSESDIYDSFFQPTIASAPPQILTNDEEEEEVKLPNVPRDKVSCK
jgi:hypothetical protein